MRARTRALGAGLVAAVLASLLITVAAEPAKAVTACDANGQLVWGAANCEIVSQTATAVREKVTYTSPGVGPVGGLVCRRKAAGNYPILVLNHSGFGTAAGDYWLETLCGVFGNAGYLVIASDYRAFGNGLATDVFCQGEVDDVLAMLVEAKKYPSADDDRVLMRGWSHGGCVTLRAYQQGVPGLVAAAAIAPVVDMDGQWQYFTTQLGTIGNLCWLNPGLAHCWQWSTLRTLIENATGGPPSATTQAEYDARSVDTDLASLRNASVPLLIAQGLDDIVVPPELACASIASVNALAGSPDFDTYHFTSTATTLTAASHSRCPGHTWNTASDPTATSFPASHYFFVVDALAHFEHTTVPSSGPEWELMHRVNQFLVAKTPPP